ncbi:MAG: nuclear transport factor 2 family protein [Bacteroidota bacterium]|uniref:Uncharacterized protein n=1 Tax=Christiangramia flava JLT2011 TaxID=1229726 RepID=A0A1L7IAG5_9FLAO|nr:nuclear transport factor 2 family protein [Christiangramia flava]APU70224.1 hypothetical protein GRFL_3500 [Christiangramia flava JLT2011]MAM18591.1 nuclear transport factor 2 family protein [Christiangramia sp.]MEE2772826.1 nuclear transport factor 2 family protein [Bacteroidota bacterium]OSS39710.1 hypothetical protein C723_1612 [Christiangramia flava JLT2011]|tara:strand:+ start:224 stop:616 length:393 start_codon:yes stop_codon:yes gene_type:complete
MSLKPTKVVESFYQSNDKDAESIRQYLHPEAELSWYGTTGLKNLDVEGILGIRDELFSSFDSLRAEIEKIFAKKENVAVHFTYHVRTIENPDEEMPLAHFVAIWELKDGKLFRGVQVSQLGEEVEKSPWA